MCALVLVCATVAFVASRVGSDEHRPSQLTIPPSTAGPSRYELHTITDGAPTHSEPPHRMIFVDGELRITSTARNTDGNQREVWTTGDDYGDVDVTLRIDEPSSLGGTFTPQPGLALRTQVDGSDAGSALVIDANVWGHASNHARIGAWSWSLGSKPKFTIDALDAVLYFHERRAAITGFMRSADTPGVDIFSVDPTYDMTGLYGFRVGDRVDVGSLMDPGYNQSNATVAGVDSGNKIITVAHPGSTGASPPRPSLGSIRFHASGNAAQPRSQYPLYIRARLIGSRLDAKTWLVDEPEPGWQLSETIPAAAKLPPKGKIGLVSNHLHGAGNYIAFGDLTIRPVVTP